MNLAIAFAYLIAAVLFILGLKQLSSPKGARQGNQTAAVGMVIALLATLPLLHFTSGGLAVTVLGIVIGVMTAITIAISMKSRRRSCWGRAYKTRRLGLSEM